MEISTIFGLLRAGQRPVVSFKHGILDKEEYAEPEMRARLLSAKNDGDGVLMLHFDFEEFAAHNKPFETSDFHGREGALVTVREAGFYKPHDDIYFDIDEDLERFMELVPDAALALYERFKKEGADRTYFAWLERLVLTRLEAAVA